jgi:hypothetical protein
MGVSVTTMREQDEERCPRPLCVGRDMRLHEMSGDASVVRHGIRLGGLSAAAIRNGSQCTGRWGGCNRPGLEF